jgi:hypothetical protein
MPSSNPLKKWQKSYTKKIRGLKTFVCFLIPISKLFEEKFWWGHISTFCQLRSQTRTKQLNKNRKAFFKRGSQKTIFFNSGFGPASCQISCHTNVFRGGEYVSKEIQRTIKKIRAVRYFFRVGTAIRVLFF